MYTSINNQIYSILHYSFSVFLLFFLLPRWLFKSEYEDKLEFLYSGYVKMVFLLILSGYILVILKLYEVLSLLMLFIAIIAVQAKQKRDANANTATPKLINRLFDLLDGLSITNLQTFKFKWKKRIKEQELNIRKKFNWMVLTEGLTLLVIIGISFYVRFYDTFTNAAPPMSDSYVTLAWMKYINNRDLFHDGIYPQGFHIYLASILKFAAVDALYILRYTGPLNTLMITVSLYIVIRKLTKNVVGGLTAAWIYGVLWVVFPLVSADRQAATNSQEFSFVFIFPAIYFLIKYMHTEKKEDLIVGLLSTAVIGLVHSLGYALIGLMIGVMLFVSALIFRKRVKTYIVVITGVILTGVLSVVPIGVGYLLGKNLNSSSAEYLVNQSTAYHFKILKTMDFVSLGSILILSLLLFRRNLSRNERFISIFTILIGLCVFILYYAGGVITHSTVLESRSADLWGLTIPYCVGISVSYLFNVLKGSGERILNMLMMFGLIAATLIIRPMPIIPYKMEYNENVEQYLQITHTYLPQTWMIVAQNEEYSISLGTGFHMLLSDFLKTYDPRKKLLTRFGENTPDRNIAPHVFIYQEKKMFEVSKTNISIYSILAPEYKQRAEEYKELTKWMKVHQAAGNKVKIFYQDKHLVVYQIDIPANIQK